MEQTAGTAYTQSTEDGFEIESSAPSDAEFAQQLGMTADPPAVEAQPAGDALEPTAAETAARERDEQGRFKAKPAADGEKVVEPEPVKPEQQRAKPKDDPQARIDQAIARQRDAERRAEAAERRARELEQPRTAAPRREEQPAPQPREPQAHAWQRLKNHPNAPQQEQFTDYTDYTAALSHFVAVQTHAELQQSQQQSQRQAAFERERHEIRSKAASSLNKAITADASFLDSADPAVVNLPTFDDLQQNQRPTVRHFIGEEIMRLGENTAPMVRYLSDHPEEFQRLATLHPRDITRQMAILETRLDAAPQTGTVSQAPVLSQAKPPVRPVTGTPLVTDDPPDPNDDDLDRHIKHYNAQDRKASRRR